jgi:hypothetical protein
MIRRVHVQNFKGFDNLDLAWKPLTILTGLNGTGKSSVIQSLLLLRLSYQQGVLTEKMLALSQAFSIRWTQKEASLTPHGEKRREMLPAAASLPLCGWPLPTISSRCLDLSAPQRQMSIRHGSKIQCGLRPLCQHDRVG